MIVVGDVNSTLAVSLVASKMGIPVVHVEAGLRSYDRTMPEEINRVLTDQLADLLYTTERSAADNLAREGIAPERVHFVGNVMIDSLMRHVARATPPAQTLSRAGAVAGDRARSRGFRGRHAASAVERRRSACAGRGAPHPGRHLAPAAGHLAGASAHAARTSSAST